VVRRRRYANKGCEFACNYVFNRLDQLGNVSRLGEHWMSVDVKPALRFGFGDESRQKNNRGVVQSAIRLNLCRYFSAVETLDDHIEQNEVRFKTAGRLVGVGIMVFLQHQIWTGSF
jgi:hypothetical protein